MMQLSMMSSINKISESTASLVKLATKHDAQLVDLEKEIKGEGNKRAKTEAKEAVDDQVVAPKNSDT